MKSKINEKITNSHTLSIEGSIDVDSLPNEAIKIEVEEVGVVDLKEYLNRFNGAYVKITITDKTEETVEE